MPGFLYFAPYDRSTIAPKERFARDLFQRDGLLGALHDLQVPDRDAALSTCSKGPGGEGGVILCPLVSHQPQPESVGYYPDRQTWQQIGDDSRIWIGWETDNPPEPYDLLRAKQFRGYQITDCHGRDWSIPIIRSKNGDTGTLPCYFKFGTGFSLVSELKPEFTYLWELSALLWDHFVGSGQLDLPDLLKAVVQILAVNYRVGPAELNALHAAGRNPLDSNFVDATLIGALDRAMFEVFLEGNGVTGDAGTPASTTSNPGVTGDCEAMPSAAAN